MDGLDNDRILEVIDTIYDAAVTDDWQSVIDTVSRMFDQVSVHLFGHDARLGKPEIMLTANHRDEMLKSYAEYYHEKNAWLPGIIASPLGEARYSREYLPDSALIKTEYYNDWILPQDDMRAGGGVVLFNDDERAIILGGAFRDKDREKKEDDLIELFQIIVPHLYRALRIQHGLKGARVIQRNYEQALDQIGNAVFVLDRQGRICHQNAAAGELFEAGGLFRLGPFGGLRPHDSAAEREISIALRMIERDRLQYRRQVFPIRRAGHQDRYFAMITPLRFELTEVGLGPYLAASKKPIALLVVAIPERSNEGGLPAFTKLYQLTQAEIALARGLHEGLSLKAYAESTEVSIHTVRNQLKSIFSKTDTTRQSELVALMARLASLGTVTP